jgi:hypothetical protein
MPTRPLPPIIRNKPQTAKEEPTNEYLINSNNTKVVELKNTFNELHSILYTEVPEDKVCEFVSHIVLSFEAKQNLGSLEPPVIKKEPESVKPESVKFDVPYITTSLGKIIPMPLTLPNNATMTVGLKFFDSLKQPISAPKTPGMIEVDNTSICTAQLSTDGSSVVITPVAAGTANITYTDGSIMASDSVTVAEPALASVTFDDADAVLEPIATPSTNTASNTDLASNGQ